MVSHLILAGVVSVWWSGKLKGLVTALLGCERVDSEVVQFEELEFLRQLLLARLEVVFGLPPKGHELLELFFYLREVLVD